MLLTVWLFSIPFLMGCVCGLRCMTGPAILCWTVHLSGLQLEGTKLAFLLRPASLLVFTLLALGELVADKLPFIPRRTMIGPLVVRILSGAFCGLVLGTSMNSTSLPVSALVGATGAVAGAFAGYRFRRWLTVDRGLPDIPIALCEDLAAIGLGLFAASGGLLRGLVIFAGFL